MPILVLASERWMRSMRTSRLATTVGDFVAREMAVLLGVVVECAVGVGLDVVDLVKVALADGLGLRPLVFGVLKGFAMGARLMVPSALAADFGACFFVVVSIAGDAEPAATVRRRRRDGVRRRSNIYCTPRGLALFGWVEAWELEAWEMTGAGSFGWGPGCVCMYLS